MLGVRHNAHSVWKIYLSKDRTSQAFGTDFQPKIYIFASTNFALKFVCVCTAHSIQTLSHKHTHTHRPNRKCKQTNGRKGKSKDEVQHLDSMWNLPMIKCTLHKTEKENNCPQTRLALQCVASASHCIVLVSNSRLSCFPLHDILYLSEELLTAIKSIIINICTTNWNLCVPNTRYVCECMCVCMLEVTTISAMQLNTI